MDNSNTTHDGYIGKERFQREVEAKRRRYHQSPTNSAVTNWGLSEIKKIIQKGPVLDLACGNGRHTQDLKVGDYLLCAGDISFPMLEEAKNHLRDVQQLSFLRLDAENLPYPDHSLEATFSARFFHHLPKEVRAKVLSEIFRVTQKAAVVTIKKRFSFEHIRTATKYLLKGKPFQYQRHFVAVKEFEDVARSHGWRVKQAYSPWGFFSANCSVLFEPIQKVSSR